MKLIVTELIKNKYHTLLSLKIIVLKKSLLLLVSIVFSISLFAQNNGGSGAVTGHVYVDPANANTGTISPGITFGGGSGEGFASKRNGGTNQWGLDFYTNFINRMVITNGGFVGIGTATPSKQLSVATGMNIDQLNQNPGLINVNTLTFGSGSGEGIGSNRVGGTNQFGLDLYTNNLPRVYITNTGSVGIGRCPTNNSVAKLEVAGAIASSAALMPSDIRYKKNIVPIHSALKTLMAISGFKYLLKTDEFPQMNFDTRTQYGLIAQQVEKVLPEIVYSLDNGYKAIDYARIIPFLVEGMKEQQNQIDELTQLQKQVDELKKIIAELIKNK